MNRLQPLDPDTVPFSKRIVTSTVPRSTPSLESADNVQVVLSNVAAPPVVAGELLGTDPLVVAAPAAAVVDVAMLSSSLPHAASPSTAHRATAASDDRMSFMSGMSPGGGAVGGASGGGTGCTGWTTIGWTGCTAIGCTGTGWTYCTGWTCCTVWTCCCAARAARRVASCCAAYSYSAWRLRASCCSYWMRTASASARALATAACSRRSLPVSQWCTPSAISAATV